MEHLCGFLSAAAGRSGPRFGRGLNVGNEDHDWEKGEQAQPEFHELGRAGVAGAETAAVEPGLGPGRLPQRGPTSAKTTITAMAARRVKSEKVVVFTPAVCIFAASRQIPS